MKKIILILLMNGVWLTLFPQTNIVPNGSFENVTSEYPKATSGTGSDYYSSAHEYGKNKQYWTAISGWTNFLKVPFCVNGVCSADVYPSGVDDGVNAHWGDKYGHCQPGEYLLNFTSTMQTDHIYYVEFYVHVGATLNANNSVGMRFFKDHPRICFTGDQRPNQPDGAAHLTVNQNISVGEWVRCSFIYRPTEDWNWLTLGDFANQQDHRAYTRWDDIKILDLGTGLCPDHWIWENTVFDNEHTVYQASSFIYAGNDFDNIDVHGPVIVKSNSDIIFRAGNHIDLDTGFFTEPGAFFETQIEGCQSDPCPLPATVSGNYFFCDSLPQNVGNTADLGVFFNWSPATHLDYDTASNPVFTAPPHDVNQITYLVTQTSVCNGFYTFIHPLTGTSFMAVTSVTAQVTVGWDSDPSPNPSISLSNVSTGDYSFSFDAQISEHTEKVCINFLESGTNNLIGPVCLSRFDDFDCCSFTYTYESLPEDIMEQLSACRDYTVLVSVKNFCFDTTAVDSFAWDRNNVLSLNMVPNIITPADPATAYSNGLNDEFCIEATGADTYHIVVSNTGGEVHDQTGSVIYSPMCIWNGQCTEFPPCTGSSLASGSYAVMVEVSNACTTATVAYNDYVVIAYDEPEKMMLLNTSNATGTGAGEIRIYPNPASDKVFVQLSPGAGHATISLFNGIGEFITQYASERNIYELSTSQLQNGIYFLRVKEGSQVKEFKLIITH